MKRFFKWAARTFGVIVLVLSALAAYAYFIEPSRLVINERTIRVSNWSGELDGFKVAAVSDIHGGSNDVSEERLRFLTERVNAQNPDIIVLLGDFVSQIGRKGDELKMPIETIAENIKGMRARYGVYAVIGNHDWWFDERRCRAALESVGIKVLENEAFSFEANNQIVTILGIEDFWKRRAVPVEGVMRNIQPQRNIIAVTHNPDSFDKLPETVSLMVAGHTHGGQVLIPLYGAPLAVAQRKYFTALYTENNRTLFTTSGFGTTGPPFRFLVPPEIAVLTLNAAE